MIRLLFIISVFLFGQNISFAETGLPVEKDIMSYDTVSVAQPSQLMAGNPNSWWNRWGKYTAAFAGTVVLGVGAGVGVGSVVAGIGIPSGAIIGAMVGLLGAVAVVRNMPQPGS